VVFVVSAMMAGFAGAVFAYQLLFINPGNFDLPLSVTVLTMVVVGGVGSIGGAVLGAFFVTAMRQLLFGTGELEFLVFGAAIIVTVVFFPRGLIGIVDSISHPLRTFVAGGLLGQRLRGLRGL
jgi:branched-chain amino acid transport system permease protein